MNGLILGGIVLLQLVCIAHCLLRGRHKGWICLIVFAPLIGSVVYLFIEVWTPTRPLPPPPDNANPLRYRPAAEQPKRKNPLTLLPDLAMQREAVDENDPEQIYLRAEAAFAQGDHAGALADLNRLRATADVFAPEARLLLARSYEAAGQPDKAETAYAQALRAAGDSLEARARYAGFLAAQGEHARAAALYAEIRAAGEAMPELSRKRNQAWLELARQADSADRPDASPR